MGEGSIVLIRGIAVGKGVTVCLAYGVAVGITSVCVARAGGDVSDGGIDVGGAVVVLVGVEVNAAVEVAVLVGGSVGVNVGGGGSVGGALGVCVVRDWYACVSGVGASIRAMSAASMTITPPI